MKEFCVGSIGREDLDGLQDGAGDSRIFPTTDVRIFSKFIWRKQKVLCIAQLEALQKRGGIG